MNLLKSLKKELKSKANRKKAKTLSAYFKSGKGEYGEGDIFLGINVPQTREITERYRNLPLTQIEILLKSKIHEERLCAIFILADSYKNNMDQREKIYNFYLKNAKFVNNWDLVDSSADEIVGVHLLNKNKKPIYKLAKSNSLWEKRIAIISTFEFIRNNQFSETLKVSKILMNDRHDLIHKAVGWMLREVGNRNKKTEVDFLIKNYKKMPRTMLRYAIEKFPEKERKAYLLGKV